ncbi:MAG: phage holin family protein [Atopobiaceae bacterium]|nr:phage holin family protein [Atopobiaceae bacterium]MCI2172729.1 phage holin family protein [Atopobiaceae bacterium]MCI2207036.1 phage holin family protein [Atopobiaceae bacterium]
MRFIGRWFVIFLAVAAAIWLVPGIDIVGGQYAAPIFTALTLALINMTLKPLMKVLSLPITCLTLGLFSLVINACALELASWFARNLFQAGITIDTFGSAILGAIVVSIVTALFGGLAKD